MVQGYLQVSEEIQEDSGSTAACLGGYIARQL